MFLLPHLLQVVIGVIYLYSRWVQHLRCLFLLAADYELVNHSGIYLLLLHLRFGRDSLIYKAEPLI